MALASSSTETALPSLPHSVDYQDYSVLECDAVWFVRCAPAFLRNLLPQYSGEKCALKIKAAGSSETVALIHQTTRRHTLGEHNLV